MSDDPKLAAERLRAFIDSIRANRADIRQIGAENRELFKEAEKSGFSPKAMREVIARMELSPEVVMANDALIENYEALLGTGAGAVGQLKMERDAAGVFVAAMVQDDPPEVKPNKTVLARRSSVALAEAARRAREQ
ncbi:GapR family DNA-binding domain-containing protein [Sphingomonas sp. SRS2]|uniref:GapR family DNA-binding domain-containing protein n=1 Tax=Sphingomonas sp. SRS2 TaxID=133190 RepID=UPI0006184545|nr:GapR family DNA-binding domain-containing protein [Sphingomonas sp. SRS2]KKC24922.1 hypothetical protein WP12_17010 [Sphingomonas sp. SRS2]